MRPGCRSRRPRAVDQFCFSCTADRFSSCYSIFLFFYNVPKFNRTFCEFASFSVCLRTHSSLGGDAGIKARLVPRRKYQAKSSVWVFLMPRPAQKTAVLVKRVDSHLT